MDSSSEAVETHLPCPDCGSSDALTLYDDGHTYCFSCQKTTYPKGDNKLTKSTNKTQQHKKLCLISHDDMSIKDINSRGLSAATCKRFGYFVTHKYGKALQVAEYYDKDGKPEWQKTRDKDKNFLLTGKPSYRFFGQQLFQNGKKLVITEGEIDCLTVSQLNGNKYPVVSLPHGCTSALKTFKENLEWLEKFDEVIVMFDMDEPGQKAAKTVCGILSPHKLKLAKLPMKDPNECLLNGKAGEVINAIFRAEEYRPDGIINAKDVEEKFFAADETTESYEYPWCKGLNKMTQGIRKGELVLLTAGTGVGKSTAAREIAYKLKTVDHKKIGMVMLEENYKKTLRELLSIKVEKPLAMQWASADKEALKEPYEELFGDGGFVLYDHFGSMEADNLLAKIRYLIVGEGCDFVIFDHISIAVSSMEYTNGDERKTIDKLMTQLRSLVEETGAGMIVISHLKKTNGDKSSFEEGGCISLDDLRGSGSLKQIPDVVIALERNQQAEDVEERNKIKIRVLKNRPAELTGIAGYIQWDRGRHRLLGEEELCQF